MQESPDYDSMALFGDFGGNTGLFMGCSFISFVELLEFLLNLCLPYEEENDGDYSDDDGESGSDEARHASPAKSVHEGPSATAAALQAAEDYLSELEDKSVMPIFV